MKKILFALILLAACDNGKIKSDNAATISSSPTRSASQDTSSLGLKIDEHEYDKLDVVYPLITTIKIGGRSFLPSTKVTDGSPPIIYN